MLDVSTAYRRHSHIRVYIYVGSIRAEPTLNVEVSIAYQRSSDDAAVCKLFTKMTFTVEVHELLLIYRARSSTSVISAFCN
jgi:hypothetical protein